MSRGIGKRQREILAELDWWTGADRPYLCLIGWKMPRAKYESTRRALAGLCDRGLLTIAPFPLARYGMRLYCLPSKAAEVDEHFIEEDRREMLELIDEYRSMRSAKCCVPIVITPDATLTEREAR